jgi:hypothetical protein
MHSAAITVCRSLKSDRILQLTLRLALPFSNYLYRMNSYTETPVNTVWSDAILALLLGLLVFAGDQAINAVFALSVVALYVAYAIPIAARFLGGNDFKPGPFHLGVFVRLLCAMWIIILMASLLQSLPIGVIAIAFMTFMSVVFLFPETPETDVADMNYTVVVFGGVIVLSLIWYYFPKYGGVHWFTGPQTTVEGVVQEPNGDGTSTDADSLPTVKKDGVQITTRPIS